MLVGNKVNSAIQDVGPEIFPCSAGDIKRLKGSQSRYYYCFVNQEGFLYQRLFGLTTVEDVRIYVSHLINDESWENGIKLFSDIRHLTSIADFKVVFECAKDVDSLFRNANKYVGERVTLCNNDREFGTHRMFQSLREDSNQQVVMARNIESAAELLKIDRAIVEQVIAKIDKLEGS